MRSLVQIQMGPRNSKPPATSSPTRPRRPLPVRCRHLGFSCHTGGRRSNQRNLPVRPRPTRSAQRHRGNRRSRATRRIRHRRRPPRLSAFKRRRVPRAGVCPDAPVRQLRASHGGDDPHVGGIIAGSTAEPADRRDTSPLTVNEALVRATSSPPGAPNRTLSSNRLVWDVAKIRGRRELQDESRMTAETHQRS